MDSVKVALVTGAAKGMGRAFAEILLRNGAKVALCDIEKAEGEVTIKEIEKKYGAGKAIFCACDVTSQKDLEAAFTKTRSTFGNLDLVINNAGTGGELANWENTIQVNLFGIIRGTRLAMQYMSRPDGNGGTVINIASAAALNPMHVGPVYAGSKAGVMMYSRSCGGPLAEQHGVRVICVCPSFTNTHLLNRMIHGDEVGDDSVKAAVSKYMDNVKILEPEDVADNLPLILEKSKPGSVWVVRKGSETKEVHFDFV